MDSISRAIRKNLNEFSHHHHTDFVAEYVQDAGIDIEYWGIGSLNR